MVWRERITVKFMNEPQYDLLIAAKLGLGEWQVESVLALAGEDNTVHFIARYRKERTGNLDENQIRDIIEQKKHLINLYTAQISALKNIEEQGKLTEELRLRLEMATTLTEVDDLYAPYRRKRKTKADIAREKGFEVVAQQIRNQESLNIPASLLENFTEEEILQGGMDIVSQDIADNPDLKDQVRQNYLRHGVISSAYKNPDKFDDKQQKEAHKFKIYGDFNASFGKLKSYQILALNRGENLGILKVKLEHDEDFYSHFRDRLVFREENSERLGKCIREGYLKLYYAIEREMRNALTERAQVDAVNAFQRNLKELLMLKPHYGESVLAIDPGYRTGCKVCVLDKGGQPLHFTKFFLDNQTGALDLMENLIADFKSEVIVIGNGTGSGEVFDLLSANTDHKLVLVNESGASVYSVSEAGQEEFPELDATDRGTISIGRRYIDCLSELVKVPVISIGVGMYQHDMNQKELENKLSEVVEDVVNLVGINLNTASVYLLAYVSGLNRRSASKIFENRPYNSREDLLAVLTPKAYEQSVGFLRVPESDNFFDHTAIHPEQYEVARFIIDHQNEENIFNNHREIMEGLYHGITTEVVRDILQNFRNAGREIRQFEGNLKLQSSYKVEDLREGDIVEGIVRNITQFGAFVDIGLKSEGLIHISQLANRFIKDPHEVVTVGEALRVKVIEIDRERGRVSLSLKEVG
ncbi:S1 RNA-binding domain-containing protein [bacterium]|nr:S1 RNA-binding domain-containing protein [bacterium]